MRHIKLFLILVLLSSCATKVPWTTDLQKKYALPEDKLKKVQFYTSGEIVLYKTKQDGDVIVKEGKLIVSDESNCDKIIIKANTPCILEKMISSNMFIVSFEFDRFIAFGNLKDGLFSLEAESWKDGIGTIKYADNKYVTVNGDVFLKVKVKKLNKIKGRERVVGGRKV